MRESVTLSLQTPARTPEVALPGQGYMLPASGSQLVPLETVNYEQIMVGLYHLDERNIKQVLRDGLLAQTPGQITGGDDPYYDYGGSDDAFRTSVVPVFEGLVRVDMLEHERRRDGLALADMLGTPAERGLYLLTARAPDVRGGDEIKWLMVSDLGLTAVKTPEGLFVTAVDTRTGQPVFDGVSVDMVTSGNRVLPLRRRAESTKRQQRPFSAPRNCAAAMATSRSTSTPVIRRWAMPSSRSSAHRWKSRPRAVCPRSRTARSTSGSRPTAAPTARANSPRLPGCCRSADRWTAKT